MNTQLLEQRGATGEPHPTVQKKSLPLLTAEEASVFPLSAQVDQALRSRVAYLDLA